MLRKILLSSAMVAFGGAAFAADLPARVAAPAPYLAAPIFTWTGFYVGLTAGAGVDSRTGSTVTNTTLTAPSNNVYVGNRGTQSNDTPFTGGVEIGYNMQFGSIVAGLETDLNYMRRNRGANGVFPAPANLTAGYDNYSDFALSYDSSRNWFGTARARLGFAFDRALIFATGGLAYGGRMGTTIFQRDLTELNTAGVPNGTFTSDVRSLGTTSSRNYGWVLGGGAEYAFTNFMSLKLEYLHVDLGRNSTTLTALASQPQAASGAVAGATNVAGRTITVRQVNNFDLVRAGVNFRF